MPFPTSLPLPKTSDIPVHHDLHKVDPTIWARLLNAETWSDPNWDNGFTAAAYIFHIRLLGSLYLHFHAEYVCLTLGNAPKDRVVQEINSCADNASLGQLGCWYRDVVVLPVWNKPISQTPTQHPSRQTSWKHHLNQMNANIEPSKSSPHVKAKEEALKRDGGQCVVTGHIDRSKYDPSATYTIPGGFKLVLVTHCSHIIQQSLMEFNVDRPKSRDREKMNTASHLMSVLELFGLEESVAKLIEQNSVHHTSNILTLSPTIHPSFDQLALWFEPTTTQNEYIVRTKDVMEPYTDSRVTLTDRSGEGIALPDTRLLAIHAAVCNVAHMSGAAGYQEFWEERRRDGSALASEGAVQNALVLEEALRSIPKEVLSH